MILWQILIQNYLNLRGNKSKFDYKKLNLLKINENPNFKRKLLCFFHSKQ
jgi:hypothetical protein